MTTQHSNKYMERVDHLYIAGGNVNWQVTEKYVGSFYKVKHTLIK